MRSSQLYAWMLLAVPREPQPLSYVLGMADGLNKLIPMLEDLRRSLGWLQAAGLIEIESQQFRRTPKGNDLIESYEVGCRHAFDLWDKLDVALQSIDADSTALFGLTEAELDAAYEEYRNRG